jgi:hypothetical protein
MTPFRLLMTAAAAAGLLLGSAPPCRADAPPTAALHEAAGHFARGVELYEEQDWRAALIEFDRAYALAPRFQALYNVAQCHYQLKDYAGALGAFERYLAEGGDRVKEDQREKVKATIDDLRGRVADVRVETSVSGAEVTVDDVVVGTSPLSLPLRLSEGRRKIAASKAGLEPVSRFVDIAGGDATEVKLVLAPAATIVAPVVATPALLRPAAASAPRGRSIAPALVGFGLGAAGVGAGVAFGLVAVSTKNDLDRVCSDRACPPSAQAQIDTLRRDAVVSTVAFSVGALGVAAGAAWWRSEEHTSELQSQFV